MTGRKEKKEMADSTSTNITILLLNTRTQGRKDWKTSRQRSGKVE